MPLAFMAHAQDEPITFKTPPPYEAYRKFIAGGNDEFGPDPPMPPKPAPPSGWRFADVTGAVLSSEQLRHGVPYWLARLDPATGIDIFGNNGIAVGDIDNDGRDEIYVCQPGGLPNKLFRWRDSRLEDITKAWGVDLLDDTSCALFLDLRNSGRQDLVVLLASGPVLFRNEGERFQLVPDAFRFARPPQGGFTGMAAADYDRDGNLDLYMCSYSFFQSEAQFRYPVPYFDARNGPPNFLFRNRLADGYFEDVTASAGLDSNNDRYSFAPAWCDFDNSGFPSLYVANDFGRNNLYKNTRGKFQDIAAAAGVEDIGPGMSACWFDSTGAGRADLYVANMWSAPGQRVVRDKAFPHPFDEAWRGHTKGNSLFRNLANGRFAEEAERRGVAMGRWGWSADAADFDNDGKPELLLTCGMMTGSKQPDLMGFFWRQVVAKTPAAAVASASYESGWNAINQFIREGYSWNGNEPNVFYVRDGEGYRDASEESGLNIAADSRAFALTDIDGDGCVDVLLKNRLGPQLCVMQNRCGGSKQRVGIRLRGVKSNRDAVGARVRVDGQTKWVSAGSGYLSQHTKTLYFGLNGAKEILSLEVLWPSGLAETHNTLSAGVLYEIIEGEAPVVLRPLEPSKPWPARTVGGENAQRLFDTVFESPIPLPESRQGPGEFVLTAEYLRGKPGVAAAYTLFRRYLFEFRDSLRLPLRLHLDSRGRAVRIGGETAVPIDLTGYYLGRPRRDYFKLGASLLSSGYGDQALPYLEMVDGVRALVLRAQIHREAGRHDTAYSLLEEALRREPNSAEAWNELGGVALARGEFAQALGHFQQAIRAKSGLTYALLNAGQAAGKLNDVVSSERYYREALASDAASAEAAQGLGLALARQSKLREAEAFFQQAVRLRPAMPAAWNNLGVLYQQLGELDKAIHALEQAIAAAPSDEMLYLNLGRVHLKRNNRDAARRVMETLLRLKPDSQVARQALRDLR